MKRAHEEMAATVTFNIQYGKALAEVTRPLDSTIGQLKQEIDQLHDVPQEVQKLMYRGLLKNDDDSLQKVRLLAGPLVVLRARGGAARA
jgi:hypothetical protein